MEEHGIEVRSKVWLQDAAGEQIFGQGRIRILLAIEETGSISAAARSLGMSYRGAWSRIQVTEERLGRPLLNRSIGGKTGGGATLTPFARELLDRFRELNRAVVRYADQAYEDLFQGLFDAPKPPA